MFTTKQEVKQASKKLLSVLLAVIMIMTSMSVCFGTISFAASGSVTDAQWSSLFNALKSDSVENASFKTTNGKYIVDDPDGAVLKAVEAYFDVFDTLANKTPATGNPNDTNKNYTTGSSEGNRVIQQVNASIKSHIKGMSGYEAYMGAFIEAIRNTASVSTETGAEQTVGGDTTNNKTLPANNLLDVADISLTVVSSSAVTNHSLDELPDDVVTEKTFTVKHAKDRYDYKYEEGSTGGCNSKTTYTRYYRYYYYISEVTVTDGAAISTATIKNSQEILEKNEKYFSYNLDQWVAEGFEDTSVITNIRNAVVGARDNVVNTFSESVYNHFFSAYDTTALSELVDKATDIINASRIAISLNELVEKGYASIITDKAALESLAQQVKTKADSYDSYAADVKAYVESHDYEGETFDRSAITDFYNAILREIQLIELRALKATIEATDFTIYTEENVTDGTVQEDGTIVGSTITAADLTFVIGTVQGWINAIGTYDSANVAEVWASEDVVAVLELLKTNLEALKTLAGYNDSFAGKYSQFIKEVYANTNLDADSADLLAAIEKYDSWYTGVKALIAEIEAAYKETVSDAVIEEHDAVMKEHLDSKYNALHERVLSQIDLATEIYEVLEKDEFKVSVITINTFASFEKAFGNIEKNVYDFLIASSNFAMPQETIDKYDALKAVGLTDYHNFIATGGFAYYEQTEIKDITRPEADDNHDAHKGDFTVTDEKVIKVIDTLEKLLADDDIKALLGNLINKDKETGEPTGEPFDIAALLTNLIDGLFTDDLLNTIMGFLYPVVSKEFAKVWAGLPESIIVPQVDTGVLGLKADVEAYLSLYTCEKATHAIGMSIFPIELAEKIRAFYPQYEAVAAVLDDVTTASAYQLNGEGDEDDTYNGDPWKDEALYATVLDENGNAVINEDGTVKTVLNFNWGIDEAENKREAFVDAAIAALSGLEPLLFALLSNQYYEYTNKVGTAAGSANVKVPILGSIPLELTVDPVDLKFMVSANPGYNNVLAPVFELLGLEAPNGNELKTTRDVLEKGLFEPLDAFIAKLAANPLETILEILPNAMYAISADRILPLLDMLKIDITYTTNATYSVIGGAISGSMNDVYKSEEPIKINVKDMINLDDMGLDLSFDGIWNMITGMLGEDVTLPKIDAGYLATLGELTWKDTKRTEATYTPTAGNEGKAAYIEANKADVLIYLVRYLLGALGENPDLLASFGLELSDDVKNIIKGATANPDKTIAAVVELFNAVEYNTLKSYVWYESELNEDTVVGMTPAIHQYLAYDNNWTRETAAYLIENIDTIITTVAGESFNLADTLSGLIGGLFTNKNITALAKVLSKIDLSAIDTGDLNLDINSLIKNFAGLDLSAFADYKDISDDTTWGFEDGDKEGFVNALVSLLAPLEPVINFILKGENLTLLDDVTLIGYNGYDTAIVPLLEALGATPAALGESDSAVAAVINALADTVASLDSVDAILDIIPGILYFVKSDGLTTAVRNLLQPVYVILETIDPVYDLNLNELIGGLTKDLGVTIDLNNLSFEAIFNILGGIIKLDLGELEEIIDDVCEVLVPVDYTSASSLIGEDGKKGAYGKFFDEVDLITVIVSFALSWIQQEGNAAAIVKLIAGDDAEKAADIQKYITGAIAVIGGIEAEYQQIDWDYNFPENYDDSIFESGLTIQPTINTITYPTNWTEDTAKYVSDNLDAIVADVLKATGSEYETVAELLKDKVNIYTADNVNAIVKAIAGLLENIDKTLAETVGLILGADLDALKAYKADEDIDTAEEFAAALADILATIQPVVDWLLFGEDYAFFSKGDADLITIKGAEGYAYGIAPILEALGVNAPAKADATAENVIAALLSRVDEILADPINEIFELLPNVIYFLNANGISVSVQNLLAGVTGLMTAVKENFGVEVDLIEILNNLVNDILPEDSAVTLDVADLDLESIFNLVQELTGLNLTPIANILIDLCVGNITVYKSASGEYGFRMQYSDDFARYDMITIILSCLLQIVKLEENEEAIKGMLGEDAYKAILNVISLDVNVPVQEFDWIFTESADIEESFSAIESSELFEDFTYGPLYTKEMEQHISADFGEFVDNIVYLTGLEVNDKNVESLSELLNSLVGGSVYNSDIVITIRDALAGLVSKLETDIPAGAHILEILKAAEIADLEAIAQVEIPQFTQDRALFVSALCDVLEPIFPVLEWLLADADLTFFVDEEKNTVITLPGAEGYAFGIIPILEVLGCEGIITSDNYNAAVEADSDVLLTSILTPLLDTVDRILENPAEEILAILPNLIYFINSNGVDTVVKNTLNAVFTLLNAIEPIAKVDLYEIIGLDLETLTFEKLFDMLIDLLKDKTGYELEALSVDTIAELTTGTLESYTSANGKTAYRMVYQAEEAKDEMVTVTMRLAVVFIAQDKNVDAIVNILESSLGMKPEAKEYVAGILNVIADCVADTRLGMDMALSTIYYIYYGIDIGIDETTGGYIELNDAWKDALDELRDKNSAAADLVDDILGLEIFEDLIDKDHGVAPNGFIAFFQKIASIFRSIVDWFKNIFG